MLDRPTKGKTVTKTFEVDVTQTVRVELDESRFTPEWMEDFRDHFYRFDTLEEHAAHLAQMCARGMTANFGDPFIEGYGRTSEMEIKFKVVDQVEDVRALSEEEATQ